MPITKHYCGLQLGKFLTEDFPPYPHEVEVFFHCLGFKLPDDYKDFLNTINGGYLFSEASFQLGKKTLGLKRFYAFVPDCSMGQPTTWTYNNAIRPARLFEFAVSSDGGYLALWLDNTLGSTIDERATAGEVWYFSDRISNLNAASDYSELKKNRGAKLLAKSFSSFISALDQRNLESEQGGTSNGG